MLHDVRHDLRHEWWPERISRCAGWSHRCAPGGDVAPPRKAGAARRAVAALPRRGCESYRGVPAGHADDSQIGARMTAAGNLRCLTPWPTMDPVIAVALARAEFHISHGCLLPLTSLIQLAHVSHAQG